jgi:hypothetical protein
MGSQAGCSLLGWHYRRDGVQQQLLRLCIHLTLRKQPALVAIKEGAQGLANSIQAPTGMHGMHLRGP